MSVAGLNRLGELIVSERAELLADWRKQVKQLPSAQGLDRPTLDDHIPDLLDELAEALRERRDESIPDVMLEGTPPAHGIQRLEDGFDLAEVVAEYNILRGAIHDLAAEHGIDIRGRLVLHPQPRARHRDRPGRADLRDAAGARSQAAAGRVPGLRRPRSANAAQRGLAFGLAARIVDR